MAPHLSGVNATESGVSATDALIWHRLNGVFWGAFLMFSATTASIISRLDHRARPLGCLLDRRRADRLGILILDAAWGWHPQGWMVKLWGYHDAYASGVVHAIAGGAAGVLDRSRSRIGKFRPDGTPRDIPPHNEWLVTIGLFFIYTGFWGFYAACNIPIISPATIAGQITGETWTTTNIYLAPTSLSAITFNFMMSLSGGLMAATSSRRAIRSGRSHADCAASLPPRPATISTIRSRPC